ncbi:MAG: metal-dependent transcriptional regulator [Planctomycetes bacterium]|nr:metal-dependent transcriptional regulator [Planctomycetota bacterium]
MRQTKAREDYLKAIYELSLDSKRVTTQDLARRLNVRSPSVTGMLKSLAKEKLIVHSPRSHAALTAKGRTEALRLRRRHGLIELFLARVLKMDMAQIHTEAEALEHHISATLEDLIDVHLGHPRYSLNGEPIPDAAGKLPRNSSVPISELKLKQHAQICEVLDHYPAQLKRWLELGLVPEARIWIEEDRSIDGIVVLHVNGKNVPLTWKALKGLKVRTIKTNGSTKGKVKK